MPGITQTSTRRGRDQSREGGREGRKEGREGARAEISPTGWKVTSRWMNTLGAWNFFIIIKMWLSREHSRSIKCKGYFTSFFFTGPHTFQGHTAATSQGKTENWERDQCIFKKLRELRITQRVKSLMINSYCNLQSANVNTHLKISLTIKVGISNMNDKFCLYIKTTLYPQMQTSCIWTLVR